jgi:hypothetical protein
MSNGGPHVQIAAFCEKAIVGQGGQLSVIGLVEQVTNNQPNPDAPDEMPPFSLGPLTLVIALWADQTKGRYAIKIRPVEPSGHELDALKMPVQFEGGPRGINLITPMQFPVEHEGTYWFDIIFSAGSSAEDRLLSRVPLEVRYQPQLTAG